MLYPQNEKLTAEEFRYPSKEYAGAPFWAWNCRMDQEKIDFLIQVLKEMGMGGAFLHSRMGMEHSFMGKEFLELIQYAHEKLKENKMLTWLYDEDRWPSGFGGGLVTKDHSCRLQFLLFTPESQDKKKIDYQEKNMGGSVIRSEQRILLGKFQIFLEQGYLKDYSLLKEGEIVREGYRQWYAYLETSGEDPGFNNQSYVNTLDKKAVKKFIEIVYEQYYQVLGGEFGSWIPGIFTDEPQFAGKHYLDYAEQEKDLAMPYTEDLEETFASVYGHSLLEHLPELFWELDSGEVSVVRYEYHNHITERFTEAYTDQIGRWCSAHGIRWTGHLMEEPRLQSQTHAVGEAMRSYRSFHIPGIDILYDNREWNTAKQCASVVHQYGKEGMLSELYGATGWDYDFRRHKLQGDWQAALGVTLRVHHLVWTSMKGEAKRDYPASIGPQSPWYREYSLVENHFSRLNTALTRGKPIVRVGVIHPIESYWLYWGPKEQTNWIRKELEQNFSSLTEWLLFHTIDFDFISEALLPELVENKGCFYQKNVEGNSDPSNDFQKSRPVFQVGNMCYEAILVPSCRTLRSTTVENLEKFQREGGYVIFAGEVPFLIDARPSERCKKLAEKTIKIPFQRLNVLNALESVRDIRIQEADGTDTENILYQMRQEGRNRWLFLAHAKESEIPEDYLFDLGGPCCRRRNIDLPVRQKLMISVLGQWNVTFYNTISGEIYPLTTDYRNGHTVIHQTMYDQDSALFFLEAQNIEQQKIDKTVVIQPEWEWNTIDLLLPRLNSVHFSEPNVSILDLAEYRFDGEEWQKEEEILKIDTKFRNKLGYPIRNGGCAQPWIYTEESLEHGKHRLSLRYTFRCETVLKNCHLGMEYGDNVKLYLDDVLVENLEDGWYVDPCIRTIPLPELAIGEHRLQVEIPYHRNTNIENMFLLGDFTVEVCGTFQVIRSAKKELMFGDLTRIGYPFYGGNVIYEIPFFSTGAEYQISANFFRTPYIGVSLDGKKKEGIAFSPYICRLGYVNRGEHTVAITVYGNRVNTFGPLHNCNALETEGGSSAWRTEGDTWAYEYQLKPMGLLKAPVLQEIQR